MTYFTHNFSFVIERDDFTIRPDISRILFNYKADACYFILKQNSLQLNIKIKNNMIIKFLIDPEMVEILSFPDFLDKIKIEINTKDLDDIMDNFSSIDYFGLPKIIVNNNGIELKSRDWEGWMSQYYKIKELVIS